MKDKLAVRGGYAEVLFLKALETKLTDKIAQLVYEMYLRTCLSHFLHRGLLRIKGK